MSVINQMLKDLEKRNNESPEQAASAPVIVTQSSSKSSVVAITVVISVLVTLAIAAAAWLYQENQDLKQQQWANENELVLPNKQAQQLVKAVEQIAQSSSVKNDVVKEVSEQQPELQLTAKPQAAVVAEQNTQVADAAPEIRPTKSNDVLATEAKETASQQPLPSVSVADASPESSKPAAQVSEPKSSLSIAVKQLTPSQLAAQKLAQAEKALFDKQGELAEQLLQDVLLLTPQHIEARKKLAAIWYAKQSYRATVNLLNQGISELPEEPDFRLMKAKILLQQNLAEQALSTLAPLAHIAHVDYQALIANAANTAGQIAQAINAYQQLAKLQPNKGKWHLGLAIAYDRDSQFEQAISAYQLAVNTGDLSSQSQQFAQQRIEELGD